jgi:hypothetical protein
MEGQINSDNSDKLVRFLRIQSLGRFSFLWLMTMGTYGLHWHYMNWRFFGYKNRKSSFFAVFSGFSIYGLTRRILRLANRSISVKPGLFLFLSVLGNIIGSNIEYGFWFFLGLLLAGLPPLYLQSVLNQYALKSISGYKYNSFFSGGAIYWSIFGLFLWSLVILGMMGESSIK